jgi:hypothetical protein
MVYAAAYCPMSFKSTLEEMGFDGVSPLKSLRFPGRKADEQTQRS